MITSGMLRWGCHVGDGMADICYCRFHAWQSSLLFTAMFVLHLLFSWSTFLGWVVFLGDLALIGWLVMKAYRDADTLDRYVMVGHGGFGRDADFSQI